MWPLELQLEANIQQSALFPFPPVLPSQCHPCHPQQVRVGSDALHSLNISINNKAIGIKLHFSAHPGCLLQTVANAVRAWNGHLPQLGLRLPFGNCLSRLQFFSCPPWLLLEGILQIQPGNDQNTFLRWGLTAIWVKGKQEVLWGQWFLLMLTEDCELAATDHGPENWPDDLRSLLWFSNRGNFFLEIFVHEIVDPTLLKNYYDALHILLQNVCSLMSRALWKILQLP